MEIKIEKERFNEAGDKYTLLTSHNGYQWSGGGIMSLDELKQIADEITLFLAPPKEKG